MGLGGAGRLCLLVLLGCAAPCASVRPLGNPEAAVPLLSREGVLAHSAALPGQPRRLVIATFSDFRNGTKQAAMVASWARNLQALRLPCVVGLSASGALTRGDVAALLLQGHCGVFRLSFASNACEVNAKVCRGYVAQQLGGWGLDLLYTDADVALLRDPLPYLGALLLRHPAMDLATSSDSSTGRYGAEDVLPAGAAAPPAERRPTAWQAAFPGVPLKQGYVAKPELASEPAEFLSKTFSGLFDIDLEYPGNCNPHQYNTGVMFVRATDASAALLAAWIEVLEGSKHDPRADDQLPLNVLLKTGAAHCSRGGGPPAGGEGERCGGDGRLNAAWGGRVCFGACAPPRPRAGRSGSGARARSPPRRRPAPQAC